MNTPNQNPKPQGWAESNSMLRHIIHAETSSGEIYIQSIADELASKGMFVSFVFGPLKGNGIVWSVDVLNSSGESFARPYAAKSLRQAAEIARLESEKRGWI